MIQQHLAQAEGHVAKGRQIVARQERLVADLHMHGHDTTDACKVLDTLADALTIHEADVQRLRDELKAASRPLASVTSR
ncbi:hypothetical protein QA645_21945 [Bradyrhizobium sp. CIAT3101]|uniref:hypothetical protein n=1 Tax=Bradyrhizobium sp. CIAT3101 TaxID=439387 RepID=UPI0024B22508|nr:hypothetical protein [Bradyrhizobium sp. CIAT3101]WFU85299.1 hypothetical protein QA645_21945 [Bradyrhizobium sp. CIAT3101]